MIRVVVLSVLVGLGGCVGHRDPVGINDHPEAEDDGDVRELSPTVFPPPSELPRPGA